jgi:vitamin B12 transporter
MFRVHSLLIGALAALSFSTVQAADDPVEPVVVTATRTPVPAAEVAVPVVVITREEIERSLAADVGELLKQHAGIEIGRNGGPGQVASLFIRGTNNDHAVVLVDGVRVNPGTIGGAAIQHILPEAIERIEIVKSPRSSLYGSDALGGVVQIFTRAAARDRFAAMASGGRYGTLNGQLDAGVAFGDRGGLGFTVGHVDSDGFPARELAVNDSGYDNTTANVLAEMRASDALTLRARAWHAEGTSDYFDFLLAPVSQDFENSAYAAEAEFRPHDRLRARVNVSRIEDDLRQNDSDDFVRTRRDAVDLQTDWRLPRGHELTAGALLQREDTDTLSFGLVFDEKTDVDMFFLQDRWSSGPHDVLVAGGFTDHETFGSETTWNAEYGVALPSRTRLSFAAGTAFHAPDATDRYGFGGNPALDPERSRQYEVGVRQPIGTAHALYVTAFSNEVDDLIVFRIVDPVTFDGRNENVEEARIRGVEAGYSLTGTRWRARLEAWVHDPRNLSTDERLLRRARDGASLSVLRTFARAELGVDVLASGERKDFGFPAQLTLDSYVLVGAGARYEITDAWSVQARLDNAFDEEYELANGFNTAGRSFTLATRYRFR